MTTTTLVPAPPRLDRSADLGHAFSDEYHLMFRQELFAALIEVVSGSGEWSEQTAAQIRTAGMEWAARCEPASGLRLVVQSVTDHILERMSGGRPAMSSVSRVELAQRLTNAGRIVTEALTLGFFEHSEREGSQRHRPDTQGDAPPGYAHMALRVPERGVSAVEAACRAHGNPEAAVLSSSYGMYIIIPMASAESALDMARRIHHTLATAAWFAVHWSPGSETTASLVLTDDICTIVDVLGYDPGVYQLDDVLVEYAAAQAPDSARRLVSLVEPVLSQPMLRDTLTALIAAEGDPVLACDTLSIRRAHLKRRLHRIEELTGRRVERPRDFKILRTAVAVTAIRHR
ncbi:helix-turn-helix domain-containing protein [Actinacidiphila glaucinigra]|uniref:helix-turn-helix domain-containing protein n=1 Tax=Actinacidiphila glaucinigra TaxID=235986 RepID=UPI003D8A01A2